MQLILLSSPFSGAAAAGTSSGAPGPSNKTENKPLDEKELEQLVRESALFKELEQKIAELETAIIQEKVGDSFRLPGFPPRPPPPPLLWKINRKEQRTS